MLSESSDSLKAKLAYASLREVACMKLLKEAYASLRALRGLLTQAFFLLRDRSWLTRAYAREVLVKIHQNPLREHGPVHFSLSARQTQSV